MMKKLILIFFCTFLISSCESYNQDDYMELVVLESYAVANRPLPIVYVSTTSPANEEYIPEEQALSNAIVHIVLLDESGNVEDVFDYNPSDNTPGVYLPANRSHQVLPRHTYRLDVQFNDRQEVLQAETTIPDDFQIINQVREQVVYQSNEQLELVVSPIERDLSQNIFVINAIALNPNPDNLTPFYEDAVVNGDSEPEDFANNSSGLINEGNFNINDDGTITLQFPWIGVAFYGSNLIVTNTTDQHLANFIRSQEVQLGGSTLSPGEIPNATYNVDGGIGIFGSIASDTVQTNFLRP